MRMTSFLVVLVAISLGLTGCDGATSSIKAGWDEVLKGCVNADQLPPKLVYFGPSNSIGPGALWRRAENGGLYVRYLLADAIPDQTQRNTIIIPGVESSCAGTAKASFSVAAGASLGTPAAPISADLQADLKKAKSIKVGVGSWSFEQIKEGPFETWLRNNTQTPYAQDIVQNSRLIIERAVKVTGLSTTVEFSQKDAIGLKAKYSGPALSTGPAGVSLGLNWTSDTTLELTSTKPFYIAGELVMFKGVFGAFATGRPLFEKVDLGPAQVAGRDTLPQ